MPHRAHVVAHSYGGVSALEAAARAPERFASLVLIEPPLWSFAADAPEVQRAGELARAFASGDATVRDAFLAMAGLRPDHPQAARLESMARGLRDPGDAAPALAALREAAVPLAIASGAHCDACERVAEGLAMALSAQHWVLGGAGHAVQRTPAFNPRLRAFVMEASRLDTAACDCA